MQYRSLDEDAPKILRGAAVRKDIYLVKAEKPMLREDVVVNRRQLLGLNRSGPHWSGRMIALTFKILVQMKEYSR